MTLSEMAKTYIGTKQGDRRHKEIIDYYNEYIRPLPRNYRMKYSDSWCACFVSVIQAKTGIKNPLYECSCRIMLQNAKKAKQTVTDPKINDIVFYDWKDDSTIDHTGIICDIKGDTLYVVEGNYSRSVKIRTISKKDKQIECFARVTPLSEIKPTDKKEDLVKIAKDVIKGKYGVGQARITALGENYKAVQSIVNQLLSSK